MSSSGTIINVNNVSNNTCKIVNDVVVFEINKKTQVSGKRVMWKCLMLSCCVELVLV